MPKSVGPQDHRPDRTDTHEEDLMDHGSTPNTKERDRWNVRKLILAKLQGAYDVLGGVWPLVSMGLFEAVTGPKQEEWLVRTVAGILVFLGALLLHDAIRRQRIDRGLRLMACGVSGVLAAVALISSVGGRISMLYFLDGLAHLSFAVGWLLISLLAPPSSQPIRRS